jgi:signal transduction histidine kinase
MRAVLSWLDRHRFVTDGSVAVSLGLVSLLENLNLRVEDRPIVVFLTCTAFLPLVFVRRYPVVVALATGVSTFLLYRYGQPDQVVIMWACYQVGRRRSEQVLRTITIGLGATYALVFAVLLLVTTPVPAWIGEAGLIIVPIVLFPIALGRIMATRHERIVFLQDQITLQALAAASATNEAVARERLAIARDLHDSLAHQLTVISYQAAGLSAVALRGPQDHSYATLIAASNAIEDAAQQSLTDLKEVVGPLRRSDFRELHPVGIAYLCDLIDQSSGESFDAVGDLESVPNSVGIVVYRVTQESLTNARRHAPGNPVKVQLRLTHHAVELTIVNPVSGPVRKTTGYGVVGMTERVLNVGGRITAGALDGIWIVSVVIPLGNRDA